MKDFLKSSTFNPEKPIYKTGIGLLFPVISPVWGRISKWEYWDGDWVDKDDLLCTIESIEIPGDVRKVSSPAMGQLYILAEVDDVVQSGAEFAGTEVVDALLEGFIIIAYVNMGLRT